MIVSEKDSSRSLNGMRTIRKILSYQESLFLCKVIRRKTDDRRLKSDREMMTQNQEDGVFLKSLEVKGR